MNSMFNYCTVHSHYHTLAIVLRIVIDLVFLPPSLLQWNPHQMITPLIRLKRTRRWNWRPRWWEVYGLLVTRNSPLFTRLLYHCYCQVSFWGVICVSINRSLSSNYQELDRIYSQELCSKYLKSIYYMLISCYLSSSHMTTTLHVSSLKQPIDNWYWLLAN